MTTKCVHKNDDTGRCEHLRHRRKGQVAEMFGYQPPCVLIGNENTYCPERELPAVSVRPLRSSAELQLWEKLGEDEEDDRAKI